jgi:hypothetical protein
MRPPPWATWCRCANHWARLHMHTAAHTHTAAHAHGCTCTRPHTHTTARAQLAVVGRGKGGGGGYHLPMRVVNASLVVGLIDVCGMWCAVPDPGLPLPEASEAQTARGTSLCTAGWAAAIQADPVVPKCCPRTDHRLTHCPPSRSPHALQFTKPHAHGLY